MIAVWLFLALSGGVILGVYVDTRLGDRLRRDLTIERDRLSSAVWRLQGRVRELEKAAGIAPRAKEGLVVHDSDGERRVVDL